MESPTEAQMSLETKDALQAASLLWRAGQRARIAEDSWTWALNDLYRAVQAARDAGIPAGKVVSLATANHELTAMTLEPLGKMVRVAYGPKPVVSSRFNSAPRKRPTR